MTLALEDLTYGNENHLIIIYVIIIFCKMLSVVFHEQFLKYAKKKKII